MKTITNKTVELSGKDVTYAELLRACNDVAPEKGWTVSEQKKALRVDTALDKSLDQCRTSIANIELEDADFEYIKPKVANMPWALKSQVLIDFSDYIEGL